MWVYDSFYNNVSLSTKALLWQLYFRHSDAQVHFGRVHKQTDGTSSGRWATDVAKMDGHLLAALEFSQLTPFPGRR